MIHRFRAKVGDDWFAFTILMIVVVVTIATAMIISNLRQTEVTVGTRPGVKITAASSTKTSDPDKKTKEPDGNEDDEDSSGGMVVQQDTQSQVLGKFVTNLLLLAVAFILVLVAMAGSITAAIIFFQRWMVNREAKKAIPPPETDPEKLDS